MMSIKVCLLFAAAATLCWLCVTAVPDFDSGSVLLTDEILEEKQKYYALDGSRALQDDPTSFCTSMMDVNLVTTAQTSKVSVLYDINTGYPNNLKRCVIFKPTSDLFLEVEFTLISTELNFDFAEVYPIQGYNLTSKKVSGVGDRLLQLSGVTLPGDESSRRTVGSVGQTLMLVLRTDGNRNVWIGFQANVQSKFRDCYNGMQVVKSNRNAQVFSDGYVTKYPSNYGYCWVITPPKGEYVQIIFTAMNTEKDMDLVEVAAIGSYDASKKAYYNKRTPPIGVYSGLAIPPQINGGTDEILLISFRSDESLEFPGFSGKIISTGPYPTASPTKAPTHADCDGGVNYFVAPPTGLAITDGHETYPSKTWLCYVISPPDNQTFVVVDFTSIKLSPAGADVIEVFTIQTILSTDYTDRAKGILATMNANANAPVKVSGPLGKSVVVQLKTDATGESDGFEATIRSLETLTSTPTKAPTGRACFTGMVVYSAPTDGNDLEISSGSPEGYPDNYQMCIVLKGVPGERLLITFEDIDIANDRIDVFPIKAFNPKKRTFRGRGAFLNQITSQSKGSDSSSVQVMTRSSLPTMISLRTDIGARGRGFKATVKLVTPPPTGAPTPVPACKTRMLVLHPREYQETFNDGYKLVPRGVSLCWVLPAINGGGYNSIEFNTVGLADFGTLEVGVITDYNAKAKSFSNYVPVAGVTSKDTVIKTGLGETMLVILTTSPVGTRRAGFTATYFAPCSCPMYPSQSLCTKAPCNCQWFNDGCKSVQQ